MHWHFCQAHPFRFSLKVIEHTHLCIQKKKGALFPQRSTRQLLDLGSSEWKHIIPEYQGQTGHYVEVLQLEYPVLFLSQNVAKEDLGCGRAFNFHDINCAHQLLATVQKLVDIKTAND